jgi:hypothetical protein
MKRKQGLGLVLMPGTGSNGDGNVHIQNRYDATSFHTLCGFCDVLEGPTYVPDGTPVTCRNCRVVYESVQETPRPTWGEPTDRH